MRMSTRCILPLSISILLSACASHPSRAPRPPSAIAPVAPFTLPAPTGTAGTVAEAAPVPTENVWDRLRGSFAMADCNADPSVVAWAQRYTQNSGHFEQNLRRALPRLVYVQQVAAQYHVPGEFALLPWVESHYQPVPARKHHPAGMWQIMPVTGRSMGLRIDRNYDARLDLPAATHAVMKLLQQYHEQFHDWRVADYAYNAGEFRLRQVTRKQGAPADEPVIPDMPVNRATREHLVKLLAIACVVREPERFQVSLPVLPDAERLVQAPVAYSMTIAQVARLAGMPVAALKQLNPAVANGRREAAAVPYLVLPATHADQLRAAMADLPDHGRKEAASTAAADDGPVSSPHRNRTHVVSAGENLWQIAREYSTSVARLEQLNQLSDEQAIQPGQVLQVDVLD